MAIAASSCRTKQLPRARLMSPGLDLRRADSNRTVSCLCRSWLGAWLASASLQAVKQAGPCFTIQPRCHGCPRTPITTLMCTALEVLRCLGLPYPYSELRSNVGVGEQTSEAATASIFHSAPSSQYHCIWLRLTLSVPWVSVQALNSAEYSTSSDHERHLPLPHSTLGRAGCFYVW